MTTTLRLLSNDLKALSQHWMDAAVALLAASKWTAARHAGGLALECALKANIARQTQLHEFPDKKRAQEAFDHDPEKLLKIAGLSADMEKEKGKSIYVNWSVAKNWQIEERYDLTISQRSAEDLVNALKDPSHGVLSWLLSRF
jgi:hypothetical protein